MSREAPPWRPSGWPRRKVAHAQLGELRSHPTQISAIESIQRALDTRESKQSRSIVIRDLHKTYEVVSINPKAGSSSGFRLGPTRDLIDLLEQPSPTESYPLILASLLTVAVHRLWPQVI